MSKALEKIPLDQCLTRKQELTQAGPSNDSTMDLNSAPNTMVKQEESHLEVDTCFG